LSNDGLDARAARAARLRLLRLPLAATAVADIWAGHLAVRTLSTSTAAGGVPAAAPLDVPVFLLLQAAAVLFYGGGMTLNDAFDALRDRTLHPERPIPSGAVTRPAAFLQGGLLLAAGLALAALAGPGHARAGGLLAGAILLYDGALKRFAIPGALAMGFCRYLDVQLGAGLAAGWAFGPALLLGAYIATTTYISTLEETPGATNRLRAALLVLVLVPILGTRLLPSPLSAAFALAPLAGWIAFSGLRALRDGGNAAALKRLVLALLLGIFLVDAGSLAGHRLELWAAGAAALVLTFPLLARLLPR
jgi:4-hydroxybenzoate polyprenyltransferase